MRTRRAKKERTATFEQINITPFTDVLLVLLIIFMIAGSSMVPSALPVRELGAEGVSALPDRAAAVTVWLGADGESVREKDGVRLTAVQLEALPRSTPVSLRAAPKTRTEVAIREVERWQERGFLRLSWGPPGLLPAELQQ